MNEVVLDGLKIDSPDTLHALLARSLRFPDYYGANLDALFDCLTDLREGAEIQILHSRALSEHLGPYASRLACTLRQAAADNPRLCIRILNGN